MNSNWCEAVRGSGDSNEKEQSDNASIARFDAGLGDFDSLGCGRSI